MCLNSLLTSETLTMLRSLLAVLFVSFSIMYVVFIWVPAKKLKKNETEEEQDNGCWNEANSDVMDLIAQRLDPNLKHLLRASLVCKSWKSHFMSNDDLLRKTSLNQAPWLLLPQKSNGSKQVSFIDLADGAMYNFKVPLGGGNCCGSCRGWLMMVNWKAPMFMSESRVLLWNPITGGKYHLPSFESADYYATMHKFSNLSFFVDKFVFCDDSQVGPTKNSLSQCAVAAIFDKGNVLAFCRPGDDNWTKFQNVNVYGDDVFYEDILYCNQTLYVLAHSDFLDPEEIKLETHTLKFNGSEHEIKLRLVRSSVEIFPRVETETYSSFSVWKGIDYHTSFARSISGDKLFLVRRVVDVFKSVQEFAEENVDEHDNVNPKSVLVYERVQKFEVYTLSGHDDVGNGSFQMERTANFGDDQVLFFTAHGSTFLMASSQLIGKNCIYFAEDTCDRKVHYPLVSREISLCYLDDGRVIRPFPSIELPMQSKICWFTPCPCSC